uniref:Cyclin_C domain-containing protein n=1 Tax=Heterorhabditis bacteriophora TaxID=37862 RepID=A0A1I7WZ70_HETBA
MVVYPADVFAVVALDIPSGYLGKILKETVQFCKQNQQLVRKTQCVGERVTKTNYQWNTSYNSVFTYLTTTIITIELLDQLSFEEWPSSTSLGPLTAGLMSCLVERHSFAAPICVRAIATFEIDYDERPYVEEVNQYSDKIAVQLVSFEREAPVAQRDPPATKTSDHEYSTMTDRNTAIYNEFAGR